MSTPEYILRTPPKSFDEMALAMLNCEQTKGQTVYQHGLSVWAHLSQLIEYLQGTYTLPEGSWRLPEWLETYKEQILASLHDEANLHLYALYHDCGKPYCRTVDPDTGQHHFPRHAEASAYIWACVGGNDRVRLLIENDMAIHTASAEEIAEKLRTQWKVEDSVCLLLAALAEVHSNAKMFGGLESTSFKMKWKTVQKRGNQILKHWFPTVRPQTPASSAK